MNVNYISEPFPHILLSDFFTDDEMQSIRSELVNLAKVARPPDMTGSARDPSGRILKKNLGIFLNAAYRVMETSPLFLAGRKIFNKELMQKLGDYHIIFKYIPETNWDNTLVQFYGNDNNYESHKDVAIYTLIVNIHAQPKKYSGGELKFTQSGYSVDLQFNQGILFPSFVNHEVTPIKLDTDDLLEGRITASTFMGISMTTPSK